MTKFTTEMGRDLMGFLDNKGLLEFGSVIMGDDVRDRIGIEYPETANRATFNALALTELAAVDYVRNTLLGHGKYLSQSNGDYRILLPSENLRQCERYIRNATKKLNRSLKLSRNTPDIERKEFDNMSVRAMMKKESIRE